MLALCLSQLAKDSQKKLGSFGGCGFPLLSWGVQGAGVTKPFRPVGTFANQLRYRGHNTHMLQPGTICNLLYWLQYNASFKPDFNKDSVIMHLGANRRLYKMDM